MKEKAQHSKRFLRVPKGLLLLRERKKKRELSKDSPVDLPYFLLSVGENNHIKEGLKPFTILLAWGFQVEKRSSDYRTPIDFAVASIKELGVCKTVKSGKDLKEMVCWRKDRFRR